MKQIALWSVLGVAVLGGIAYTQSPLVVDNVKTVTEYIEKTEVVSELDQRIKDAQEAAQAEIQASAQAAYDAAIDQAMLEIEHDVTKAYREEIEAKEDELAKQVGVYWTVRDNIIKEIRAAFPEDPHTAVAIATCESNLNPNAYNDKNVTPTVDRSLFQINSVHDARLEALGLDPWNPADNIAFARMLYDEQGWRPWVCAWSKDHLALNV